MIRRGAQIRECIIPDISVKILNLCLSDDENGILMPITQRKSKTMDFRADWALQSVIKERIENKTLPLVLRKKQLYENRKKLDDLEKKSNGLEDLLQTGCAPFLLRKHLLYQQCRAG